MASSFLLLSSICPSPAGEDGALLGGPDGGSLRRTSPHRASLLPAPCSLAQAPTHPPQHGVEAAPPRRTRSHARGCEEEEEEEEDGGREERAHVGRKQGPGAG